MIDEAFVKQYDRFISFCILQYTTPPIDDYKQDIYLKLCERCIDHNHIKAYIKKITQNYFYDRFRRKKELKNLLPSATNPDDLHLLLKDVNNLLDTLPGGQCVKLYAEGYKYIEIADNLHLSLSSVKSRIHSVRIKLNCDKNAKKHNEEGAKQISKG